ncbi:MAG TPA: NAD(P)/FAD-dependent oxidoreductase [Feifaniaceae bacterium]|nr:NAD(P)/FAD-dependent oxidoreductase [Feifaniaceae bacterium]
MSRSQHQKFDVLIVGGGAVGSAIAYRLSRYDFKVAVLEKEPDVAIGTSGRNSAVVHAGFNNRAGSLMAKLCVEGNRGFESAAATLDVPYRKTGKLVVGYNDEDRDILLKLIETGEQNGCSGLRLIGEDEIRALEPNVPAKWAMISPNTAIINPFLYNIHLAEAAAQNGVTYLLNREVTAIERHSGGFTVTAGTETFDCALLINSAGLFADQISAMAGDGRYTIYPCRGEYYLLDKIPTDLLHMPVYPVPRPGVGGLGVHLTPTIDGNIILGPSAEYVERREEFATTAPMLRELGEEAKLLLPALDLRLVIGAYAGVRAKLVAKGAANYGDFVIEESPLVENFIHLIGIESPGLTASLPIANRIEEMVCSRLHPALKSGWRAEYRGIERFCELSDEEKAKRIAENPDYGEVVCRCETVTKAEIKQAIENPLGARAIVSVKNRVRATMGRCSGGYCLTRIMNILHFEYGVPYEQIDLRRAGDHPFAGVVK